jgi:hypothetical protein
MNDPDIEIAIDEVLLDGPLGARSGVLREALAGHLARLVAEHGLPAGAAPGGRLHLPRAAFDVPRGLGPDAVAAHVARGLYAELAAAGSPSRAVPGGRR